MSESRGYLECHPVPPTLRVFVSHIVCDQGTSSPCAFTSASLTMSNWIISTLPELDAAWSAVAQSQSFGIRLVCMSSAKSTHQKLQHLGQLHFPEAVGRISGFPSAKPCGAVSHTERLSHELSDTVSKAKGNPHLLYSAMPPCLAIVVRPRSPSQSTHGGVCLCRHRLLSTISVLT
jgi:hypothetical protein